MQELISKYLPNENTAKLAVIKLIAVDKNTPDFQLLQMPTTMSTRV